MDQFRPACHPSSSQPAAEVGGDIDIAEALGVASHDAAEQSNFTKLQRSGLALIQATHDASASVEMVVGPKICLYWNREGPDVAGLRAEFLHGGVTTWVAW
jgi:hypothetical protein